LIDTYIYQNSHILLSFLLLFLLILAVLVSDDHCLLIEGPRVIIVAIEIYVLILSKSPKVVVLVECVRLGGVLVKLLITEHHVGLVEKEVAAVLGRGQGHASHICHLVFFILIHTIFMVGVIYD
jgi:hypothetical protein